MISKRFLFWPALAGMLAMGLVGCSSDAEFYYGEPLDDLKLSLSDPDEGIYPNTSVLLDPNNPFAQSDIGASTKWEVQSYAAPVAAFYSWATLLARQPNGEAQYYVGFNFKVTYENGNAVVGELPAIHVQAIRAFQAVLDYFPEAVTYDDTKPERIAHDLATLSYQLIVALGGKVQGGWVLLQTTDGHPRAVKP
jgi:hypothetical protein